jgi:hypothetical protein
MRIVTDEEEGVDIRVKDGQVKMEKGTVEYRNDKRT